MNESIVFLNLSQLIFSQSCTEAEGQRWHENHFCCQDCAGPLGAGRYALPGGSPCCPSCFVSRYRSADSSSVEALEGLASLGKGGDGAILRGRGRRLRLIIEAGNLPGQNPSSHSPCCLPTATPDASIGARSSHRASQACALRRPPEPSRLGCGAKLAPGLGTQSPTGGRRRGPLG